MLRHKSDTTQSCVYFAGCGDFVKIGVTASLKERMGALATANPFSIVCLGTLPGDKSLEAWLHRRFAPECHAGEWFYNQGSVAAFIRECVTQRHEGKRAKSLAAWRSETACEVCGGRLRATHMAPEDDLTLRIPAVVCRTCDATWECLGPPSRAVARGAYAP